MRDISPTLLSAQNFEQTIGGESGKRMPYIGLVFNSKDGSIQYDYSDRSLAGEEHIYPTSGYATIFLADEDDVVEDIQGFWVEIVKGDYFFDDDGVITGYEGTASPRLWVKSQLKISSPKEGKIVVLQLEGQWELLKEDICLIRSTVEPAGIIQAPYHTAKFIGATVHHILAWILWQAGMYLPYPELEQDDGVISTVMPEFEINSVLYGKYWDFENNVERAIVEPQYETDADVVIRLLNLTKSYLRAVANTGNFYSPSGWNLPCFEIVYPSPAKGDREPNEEYYSYQDPYFYEFVHKKGVTIPNNILVYCDINEETGLFNGYPDNLLIGHAQDDESIASYGTPSDDNPVGKITKIYVYGGIRTQEDADKIVDAILSKFQIASSGGRLIIPYDARVELFDLVKVYDDR